MSATRNVLVAAIILAADIAAAQSGPYGRISVSFTPVYESNLFGTSVSRDVQGDVGFRVGPILEAGYLSPSLTLKTRYGFEAERYGDHSTASTDFARQNGAIDLRRLITRRLTFETEASYLETRSPNELNLETALVMDRARASRLSLTPTVRYALAPTTRLSVGYGLTRDALAGRGVGITHDLSAGLERHPAKRDGQRLDYRFRHFDFGNGDSESLHVITAGWSRALTRRTGVDFVLGPRLSTRAVRPELSTSLWWRLQKGYVSGGYARTHATVIGDSGLVDVQRVAATAAYRPRRHMSLTASPAFIASVHDRTRVSVYLVDLEAIGWTTRGLSVAVAGRIGQQQGTLADRREQVPINSLSLRLITTLPRSTRDGGGGPPPFY